MVRLWGALVLVVGLVMGGSARAAEPNPVTKGAEPPITKATPDPVVQGKSALKSGSFPWYDADRDDVRTIKLRALPEPPAPSSTTGGGNRWRGWWPGNWGIGDFVVFVTFSLALVGLAVLVAWFWKRFEPPAEHRTETVRTTARIGGGEVLPAALRLGVSTDDPWSDANRRRLSGDYAGAVLCLFAHQLLTLSRLSLVRLAPGRTGRQLQRAVADREFQALILPTLRQFEAVYYGHRLPSEREFATVWTAAEAFERRLAEQGKR